MAIYVLCRKCQGTGHIGHSLPGWPIKRTCKTCQGNGRVQEQLLKK